MNGRIKRVVRNLTKRDGTKGGGYGFIADENNDERFFHLRDLVDVSFDQIKEGDFVEFTPRGSRKPANGSNDNGLQAAEVRRKS